MDELITQLGLLLTQTRFARRALEDIERATATYGTFAFTSVITAGPKFGEPPLLDGALKVYVVNINDLAPGRGFGDFLQGLLGGLGSFVGNLGGGLAGSTIASMKLIGSLPVIDSIAKRVENILTLIGVGAAPATKTGGAQDAPAQGSNLIAMLNSIRDAVQALTGLFLAAGGQPQLAAGMSSLPGTPEGERWQKLADSTTVLLAGVSRVVDGLIITLPVVLGSLAWLFSRLPDLRHAIAETLQFTLRNVLLVRGSVGVIAFDTLAMVARMGADLVRILAETVVGIIGVVADGVQEALLAVLHVGAALGDAVKTTVDKLLGWLIPTIDSVLRNLGDLRVFRVITHVVRVLPAIIEPIYEIIKDKPVPNPKELHEAAAMVTLPPVSFITPGAGAGAKSPPPAPDLRAILTDKKLTDDLTGSVSRIRGVATNTVELVGEATTTGLRGLAGRLEKAAVTETKLSADSLGQHLAEVRKQSTALAGNLVVGEQVQHTDTGLDAIAGAYQGWLREGGLKTLLDTITTHFSSEKGSAGVPQRITEGAMDRPRASVQIDEVVIEVDPTAGVPALEPSLNGPGDFPLPSERDDMERYGRMWFDYNLRGGGNRLPAIV